ncbi:MAG: PqqD family peptide modification chaperone [Clostridia bacterium]|nr:PqqD family peptide modification chaperone [Clostridia bacterium]
MKNSSQLPQNYLERKPTLSTRVAYKCDDDGIVTIERENKGVINRIAQKLFFKPAVSFIHLDELGSYAVLCADGQRDILRIGEMVKDKFGERAEPLYERLAKFFQIMDSYNFIEWK